MQKVEFEQRAGLKKELTDSEWDTIECVYMNYNFMDVPDFLSFWKINGFNGVAALFSQVAYVAGLKAEVKKEHDRGAKENAKAYALETEVYQLKRKLAVYETVVSKDQLVENLEKGDIVDLLADKMKVEVD